MAANEVAIADMIKIVSFERSSNAKVHRNSVQCTCTCTYQSQDISGVSFYIVDQLHQYFKNTIYH